MLQVSNDPHIGCQSKLCSLCTFQGIDWEGPNNLGHPAEVDISEWNGGRLVDLEQRCV